MRKAMGEAHCPIAQKQTYDAEEIKTNLAIPLYSHFQYGKEVIKTFWSQNVKLWYCLSVIIETQATEHLDQAAKGKMVMKLKTNFTKDPRVQECRLC